MTTNVVAGTVGETTAEAGVMEEDAKAMAITKRTKFWGDCTHTCN